MLTTRQRWQDCNGGVSVAVVVIAGIAAAADAVAFGVTLAALPLPEEPEELSCLGRSIAEAAATLSPRRTSGVQVCQHGLWGRNCK